MKVTKEWIHKHKTDKGGWTSAQLEALGVTWPPQQGWINKVEGVDLTDEQAQRFIHGKEVHK